ncbi:MAG: hypothetical protein MUC58_11750 [Rhizobiaceae bacterium]|jgi:hypothetical protein|nr:hypothetical protein [Rhizobiaceae bacterium]
MGFHDQDLRDTALDWLNQANATPNERASFSGHAERNASAMERHYVSASIKLARAAAAKRDAWLAEELAAAEQAASSSRA